MFVAGLGTVRLHAWGVYQLHKTHVYQTPTCTKLTSTDMEETPTMEELRANYHRIDELWRQLSVTARTHDRLFTRAYLGSSFEHGDYPMDVCEEVTKECKRKYAAYGEEPELMLDYYLQSFGYVLNTRGTVYRYRPDGVNEYPDVRMRSQMQLDKDLHPEVFSFVYQKIYWKKEARAGRARLNALLRPKVSVEEAQAKLRKRAREDTLHTSLKRVREGEDTRECEEATV